MRTTFLCFETEGDWLAAAEAAEITMPESGSDFQGAAGMDFSILGSLERVVLDENGEPVTESVQVDVDEDGDPIFEDRIVKEGDPRFHVNALFRGDIPEAFEPYIIPAPATPARIFA